MLKAPTDADLVRLRQFLNRLESDAKDAVEDAELFRREIDRLKSEIAYLEAARSKAYLAQIGIDFGAADQARWNNSAAARQTELTKFPVRGRPALSRIINSKKPREHRQIRKREHPEFGRSQQMVERIVWLRVLTKYSIE